MFLKDRRSENLVKVADLDELFNPLACDVHGRSQAGEEEQEVEAFAKRDLLFPSGEPLPRCWVDAHYRLASAGSIAEHARQDSNL
jgi:hypothetical protein